MPPCGFSNLAIKGALEFVKACYEDLLAEVKSGKHKTYEAAIEFELKQIDKALSKLHINSNGDIVLRE